MSRYDFLTALRPLALAAARERLGPGDERGAADAAGDSMRALSRLYDQVAALDARWLQGEKESSEGGSSASGAVSEGGVGSMPLPDARSLAMAVLLFAKGSKSEKLGRAIGLWAPLSGTGRSATLPSSPLPAGHAGSSSVSSTGSSGSGKAPLPSLSVSDLPDFFRTTLVAVLAHATDITTTGTGTGSTDTDASATTIASPLLRKALAIERVAGELARDVMESGVVTGSEGTTTFNGIGAWYNRQGYGIAPHLELLDHRKWNITLTMATGNGTTTQAGTSDQ